MKVFVVFSLLLALVAAEHLAKTSEEMQQIQNECAAELEIHETLLALYKESVYPNDTTTQCYMKCVLTKADLLDNNAGLNIENVHQQLMGSQAEAEHDDELHAKIEACADNNEQGLDACERAHRAAKCLMQNDLHLLQENAAPAPETTPAPTEAEAEA